MFRNSIQNCVLGFLLPSSMLQEVILEINVHAKDGRHVGFLQLVMKKHNIKDKVLQILT